MRGKQKSPRQESSAQERGQPGMNSEPMPEDALLSEELLDEGPGPLRRQGELRGDQQALTTDSQFGAVPKGTKHRGRSD